MRNNCLLAHLSLYYAPAIVVIRYIFIAIVKVLYIAVLSCVLALTFLME